MTWPDENWTLIPYETMFQASLWLTFSNGLIFLHFIYYQPGKSYYRSYTVIETKWEIVRAFKMISSLHELIKELWRPTQRVAKQNKMTIKAYLSVRTV